MQFVPGMNPRRVFTHHRERGPKQFTYTYQDILDATGGSRRAFQPHASQGVVEVASYVARRWNSMSQPLTDEQVAVEIGSGWENCWPRLRAHRCGSPACENLLLHKGTCPSHGGLAKPPFIISNDRYLAIYLVGGYKPYHKVVLPVPGLHVHHIDKNKWNNRIDNLIAITEEEHMAFHRAPLRQQEALTKMYTASASARLTGG